MEQLDSYRKLYFFLFAAMAEAVEHLEEGHAVLACDCLIRAQREAEAACMDIDIFPEQ